MAAPRSSAYRGWYFDRENSTLDLYVGFGGVTDPTEVLAVTTTTVSPGTSDGVALGTTALMYADLFLASGGVINFNNGDVTLTHSANVLTIAGGDVVLSSSGFGLNIGSGTQVTISDGGGATDLIPEVQALGVGTAFAGGTLLVATFNATNDRTVSPKIALLKGAAATQVATTAVADNEVVGSIIAYGSDSGDFETPVAAIEFVVDDVGAPGASAIGGSLEFYTTADGGTTLTLAFTINNDQNIFIANNNGVVIGHTAQITANTIGEMQVLGTAENDSTMILGRWTAAGSGPFLTFVKSRNATIGSSTIVQSGDDIAGILFIGDDGTDFVTQAAAIFALVDGTPGENDMPGRLEFRTTADGAAGTTTRVTIASTGLVTIAAGSTPASVATTPGTAHAGSITATGGLGGDTSIATTGVGGIGGGFSFTGGAGGTANSATTAATGGAGGAWVTTTGAGAAAAVAGTTATGGAGGAITLTTGAGGAVSLAVSGTATGGAAGLLTIRGGVGGAVTATTGTNVGGAGGGISIIAGAGGAASGATDTGGAGGIITITPGAGGTGDANAAGKPGYVNITTSYTRRSVQTIDMADAAVTLTVVPGTPAGTLMTSDVLYVDANSATTENLLLPHEADLTGIVLVIVNTGGETINIQNDAAGAVLTLETANTAFLTCDGTTWRGVVGIP